MPTRHLPALLGICTLFGGCDQSAVNDTESEMAPPDTNTGVNLVVSCNPAATVAMQRAVSELHNMMYVGARTLFVDALTADAGCVMARWGVAMTHIHPLWPDRPGEEVLTAMEELVGEAVKAGAPTARERGYLATVQAYYQGARERSEGERLQRFATAWRELYDAYPNDLEAKAFHALSLLATADPYDKSYVIQKQAGALAEEVLAAAPDHPGAHHYVIHSYDYPGLAERALPVAMHYGEIAPETAHALHMMSHIFTRLGMWEESIEWNRRSAAAAWRVSQEQGGQNSHYHHALDYLGYAYLQLGRDAAAAQTVQDAYRTDLPYGSLNPSALAHALAALPVRHALERRDWAGAASLTLARPNDFDWGQAPPAYLAMFHYARALGLAHEQDFAAAENELQQLVSLREQLTDTFWKGHVNIKITAARGWLRYHQGERKQGLAALRRAGELEAATDKHAVTPGYVLPARELLGEVLLASELYEEALAAFEASLAESPGRLNSLRGQAQALTSLGLNDAADAVWAQIGTMTTEADRDGRPWLATLNAES